MDVVYILLFTFIYKVLRRIVFIITLNIYVFVSWTELYLTLYAQVRKPSRDKAEFLEF